MQPLTHVIISKWSELIGDIYMLSQLHIGEGDRYMYCRLLL